MDEGGIVLGCGKSQGFACCQRGLREAAAFGVGRTQGTQHYGIVGARQGLPLPRLAVIPGKYAAGGIEDLQEPVVFEIGYEVVAGQVSSPHRQW